MGKYFFEEDPACAETRQGIYRGRKNEKCYVWKGIRYAEAPAGDGRFGLPQEAAAFEGVREAYSFGNPAMQHPAGRITAGMSEDCLFLNIWSPKADGRKRPVMVYIHGGSFVKGAGSDPEYDGTILVSEGNVVLVTINYRLGAFGFLDFSALGDGFKPNCGLHDCTAALKWIKENIEAFGGDAGNITVFGQSAGAFIISALLTIKEASDCISKAILMSAGPTLFRTKEDAQNLAAQFMQVTGLDTAEKLKKVSAEELLAAQEKFKDHMKLGEGTFMAEVDGEFLKEYPVVSAKNGSLNPSVPVLMGTTREEMSFLYIKPIAKALDIETMFSAGVDREEPELQETVQEKYKRFGKRGPAIMMSDLIFKLGCTWFAEEASRYTDVWLYSFDYETAFMKVSGLHSFHFSDLPFVFGNYRHGYGRIIFLLTPFKKEARRISKMMRKDFLKFVRTGKLSWEKCSHDSLPAKCYNSSVSCRQLIDKDIRDLYKTTRYKKAAFGESDEGVF